MSRTWSIVALSSLACWAIACGGGERTPHNDASFQAGASGGASGDAGAGGTDGSVGDASTGGGGGAGGTAGSAGSGGDTGSSDAGIASTGGSVGTGGTEGGTAGTGGNAGAGGSAGTGGSAGAGGSAGTGGRDDAGGSAGAGGTPGVDAAVADTGTDAPVTTACSGATGLDPWCTAPRISAYNHVCAIKGTTLSCWGQNEYRQVGVASPAKVTSPNVIPGEWRTVSAGTHHTCAIDTGRRLYCWGYNYQSALGRGTTTVGPYETPVEIGQGFVQVASGYNGNCALKEDGSVWCWGGVSYMRGGSPTSTRPGQVPGIANAVALSIGRELVRAVVAVTSATGTSYELWGWGRDYSLTNGISTATRIGPLGTAANLQLSQGYRYGMVLLDQKLWGWNNDDAPKLDAAFTGQIVDVATNSNTLYLEVDCLLDDQKDVWCRGDQTRGQTGTGFWENSGRTTTTKWQRIYGQRGVWKEVAVGAGVACALDESETPWCWGFNGYGQLGDGTQLPRSYPAKVGEAPPAISCTDGLGNGEEDKVDCGGTVCPACPTCTDGIKNQDETDVDCGGATCTGKCAVGQGCNTGVDCGCTANTDYCKNSCAANKCVGWCVDLDGDGFGNAGPTCPGADCDENDAAWHADCWRRDKFPKPWPVTIKATGQLTQEDNECPMGSTICRVTGCTDVGNCQCTHVNTTKSITLDVTMNANGTTTIQAPYQPMCAQDYLCDISGPDCPVPTSFTENLLPQTWHFDPRPFDQCREGQVELRATFNAVGGILNLEQECYTQLWDVRADGSQRLVYDQRVWRTRIDLTK